MTTYATVTGTLTVPDDPTDGVMATIVAAPQVTGGVLSLDDHTTLGSVIASTDTTTGAFSLRVPVPSVPVFWAISLRLSVTDDRRGTPVVERTLGVYPITADIRFEKLVPIDVTAVTSKLVADLYAARDAAVASATGAQNSAAQAAASGINAGNSASDAESAASVYLAQNALDGLSQASNGEIYYDPGSGEITSTMFLLADSGESGETYVIGATS